MSTTTTGPARRETLNIRIPAETRALIDRAAELGGKTRTDFILEVARKAAEDALLERALLSVGPDAYAAFLERLDAPAQPNEALRRTLRAPIPWSRG